MELNESVSGWLESVGGTSPKVPTRFHRDLSDGYFVADVIKRYFPKLVELHNYSRASSLKAKKANWEHLNRVVFPKIGIKLSNSHLNMIAESKEGGIELLLNQLYNTVMKVEAEKRQEEEIKAEEISPQWVYVDCGFRKLHDGTVELKYKDQLFIPKVKADDQRKALEKKLEELSLANKHFKSQVARLQITIGLKEARLEDLTNDLQQLRNKFEKPQ